MTLDQPRFSSLTPPWNCLHHLIPARKRWKTMFGVYGCLPQELWTIMYIKAESCIPGWKTQETLIYPLFIDCILSPSYLSCEGSHGLMEAQGKDGSISENPSLPLHI